MSETHRSPFSLSRNLRVLFFSSSSSRWRAVDGWRAMCTIWVVLFHVLWILCFFLQPSQILPLFTSPISFLLWNDLPLNVLFMFSGFLIAHSLFLEHQRQGTLSIGRYYRRRWLRIFPSYLVTLWAWWWVTPFPRSLEAVFANLLGINNF